METTSTTAPSRPVDADSGPGPLAGATALVLIGGWLLVGAILFARARRRSAPAP